MKRHGLASRLCSLVFSLCLLLTVVFGARAAYAAASAESVASIDWDGLITPDLGVLMTWTSQWTPQGSSSYGYASGPGLFDSDYAVLPGWVDTSATRTVSTSRGNATGSAYTNSSELLEATRAESDIGGSFYSSALADRYGGFTVSGSGGISVSADYDLSYALTSDRPYPADYAYADSSVYLYLYNYNTGGYAYLYDYMGANTYSNPPSEWTGSRSGTLAGRVDFSDGDLGYFYTDVYNDAGANSVVPEPGTFLLFGTGLAGLAGFRRKLKG